MILFYLSFTRYVAVHQAVAVQGGRCPVGVLLPLAQAAAVAAAVAVVAAAVVVVSNYTV